MKATRLIDAPQKPGDAGYDLRSDRHARISIGGRQVFECAAVAIPDGWCGLIIGRSSNNGIGLFTVFGLIDSGFRGSIRVMLYNFGDVMRIIKEGERIAQLVLVPFGSFPLEYVDSPEDLALSERGTTGFGSTGKS